MLHYVHQLVINWSACYLVVVYAENNKATMRVVACKTKRMS